MSEKTFIPDTEHMQTLVLSILRNTERQAKGYVQLLFAEKIERTLEGIAPEVADEFVQIAIDLGGYKPTLHQIKTLGEAANDDSFE